MVPLYVKSPVTPTQQGQGVYQPGKAEIVREHWIIKKSQGNIGETPKELANGRKTTSESGVAVCNETRLSCIGMAVPSSVA